MSGQPETDQRVVLHLIVVGFHHKKGCLVEYCYPPVGRSDRQHNKPDDSATTAQPKTCDSEPSDERQRTDVSIEMPSEWRTLPSLALPDGSHNHERDAIYFHLPDIDDHNRTIYGVSCYRQISAKKLIARTSDMTRDTVQKSVVVLCRLPLYGLIEAKLEMITHAYFRELDFSKVSLLNDTYHNLNAQLTHKLMLSSELFVGLTPRLLVQTFHHKILVLFKLLLLERRVLFYKSPVKDLCVAILSLCSLMPGLIQKGLTSCSLSVHPKSGRQSSLDVELSPHEPSDEFYVLTGGHNSRTKDDNTNDCKEVSNSVSNTTEVDNSVVKDNVSVEQKNGDSDDDLLKEIDEVLSDKSSNKSSPERTPEKRSQFYDTNEEPKPERVDKMSDNERAETPPILKLPEEECGLPLELFTCGAYLQPYLSLTYLDVLSDVRVRSCLVGATNILFKQKRDLFDVIVELDHAKIELIDPELKKQLTLTTEDLRFADFLVKTVLNDCKGTDIFSDGTGWEGSDEWIRYQFKVYLLHMLRSSEMDESSRDFQCFNSQFMNAWRSTHNYKLWSAASHPAVFEVSSGHPFGGQLSVSDMRLKFSQLFLSKTSSDQQKKLNETSRAVTGAVTQARSVISSAVTNLWTNWSTSKSSDGQPKRRLEAETQL